MFDLLYYLKGRIAKQVTINSEGEVYTEEQLANDIANYMTQREMFLTPEEIGELNKNSEVTLQDGSRLIMQKNYVVYDVLVGKGVSEWLEIAYKYGCLASARFYSFPDYGGFIYGEYDEETNKVNVDYYNAESVDFAKGIYPYADTSIRLTGLILDSESGLLPDGKMEYELKEGVGFTEALNAALYHFDTTYKRSL